MHRTLCTSLHALPFIQADGYQDGRPQVLLYVTNRALKRLRQLEAMQSIPATVQKVKLHITAHKPYPLSSTQIK